MFDERVEYFMIAKGLLQSYENNRSHFLNKEDKPKMALDLKFVWMTSNAYLEKISEVIKHPLEEPYHKEFLVKHEMLEDTVARIEFIFDGKAAIVLRDFVLCYKEILFQMYQYQIYLKKMEESADEFKWGLDEALEKMNESQYRKKLNKAIDNLEQTYDTLEKKRLLKKLLSK